MKWTNKFVIVICVIQIALILIQGRAPFFTTIGGWFLALLYCYREGKK